MNPKLKNEIKKTLDGYSPSYNAHNDRLAERWEHEESVNELLALLRKVLEDEPKTKVKK